MARLEPSASVLLPLSLTTVCKQMRQETLPIFWALNKIIVRTTYFRSEFEDSEVDDRVARGLRRVRPGTACFNDCEDLFQLRLIHEWGNLIGQTNRSLIRHLTLDLSHCNHPRFYYPSWPRVHRMLDLLGLREQALHIKITGCDYSFGKERRSGPYFTVDFELPLHDKDEAGAVCKRAAEREHQRLLEELGDQYRRDCLHTPLTHYKILCEHILT